MYIKRLLLFLCLWASVADAQVQPPNPPYTNISQGYNWLRGYFRQLHMPNMYDTVLATGQWNYPGAFGILLDDSIPYYYNGVKWKPFGTTTIPTWQETVDVGGMHANTGTAEIEEDANVLNIRKYGLQYPQVRLLTHSDDEIENEFTVSDDSSYSPKRISYTYNINGTLTANSLVTKGYADSIAGRKRFGVAGEDDVMTQNRQIEIGEYNFTFFTENGFNKKVLFDLQEAAFLVESDSRVSLEGSDSVILTTQNNGENQPSRSEIGIYDGITSGGRGITMKPALGNLVVDSLYTTSIIAGKLMLIHDTATGRIWRTPIPSGISLAAVGSSPNANGASLSGSTLTLQPASASFPGLVNTTTQSFAGAKTFTEDLTLKKDQASGTTFKIENLSSGSGAEAKVQLTTDVGDATFGMYGSNTSFGIFQPGNLYNYSGTNGGIAFMANSPSASIRFASGGTSETMRISAAGDVGIATNSPSAKLDVNGTFRVGGATYYAIRTVTGTTTAASTDRTILVDATSGAVTINLPAASSVVGIEYIVKKIDGSVNAVTIDGNGSETIDGATTKVLNSQWEITKLQATSGGWYIIP